MYDGGGPIGMHYCTSVLARSSTSRLREWALIVGEGSLIGKFARDERAIPSELIDRPLFPWF